MHAVWESCPSQGWDQISHEEDTVLASEEGDDSSVLQIEGGGDSPVDADSLPVISKLHGRRPPPRLAHRKPPFVGETAQSGRKGGVQANFEGLRQTICHQSVDKCLNTSVR